MGFLTKLFKLICASVLVYVGILLGPTTLPKSVKFTEFYVSPTKDLGEALSKNNVLNNAERMFEDEIKAPEAFEILNGELYTTLHGGFVAKIYDDQVVPVVKFGQPCEGWWEESKCGRPLGIKAYGKDHLIVADAYFGIFKYNIKTRKFTNLVDRNTIIDGQKPQTFNSVEVAKDGTIYWTHSSSDFSLENNIFIFLADGSGRLIKYDPVTQKNQVLMKDLFFANGVVLSPEEDFLLVAETGHSRIHKMHLKGPKKLKSEIFIDGLPGMPDNLRSNGAGGFFVPLVAPRDEKNPAIFQVISPFPSVRNFAARFLSLIEVFVDKIYQIYPNYFLKRAHHYVGHLESIAPFLPLKTTVLELDFNGNVIKSYQGTDGSVTSVSDVIIHNGYMYLGSYKNNYLARVKVSKLGRKEIPVTMSTQTSHATTTPRPTTTTPKPTTARPTTPRPTTTTPRPTTTAKPTTTTPRPTTTAKPTTTTPRPTTTAKPTTTTPRPTTTAKPTTTTPRPTTTSKPSTTREPVPPTTKPPSTTSRPTTTTPTKPSNQQGGQKHQIPSS